MLKMQSNKTMVGTLKVELNSGDIVEVCIELSSEPEATTAVMNLLSSIKFENKNNQFIHEITRSRSLNNQVKITSLPAAVDMYKKLEKNIDTKKTNRIIITESFNSKFIPVIKDFSDNYDIKTDINIKNKRGGIVLASLPSFFLGILAQLFWVVYNLFKKTPSKTETTFFYGPARFDNFSPILNSAENNPEIKHKFVSKAIKPIFFLPKNVRDHNPVSLGRFTKSIDIWYSIKLILVGVIPEILIDRNVESSINKQVYEELDVSLPETIELHYTYAYDSIQFWEFPKYISAMSAIKQMECTSVVVDSTSSINRAIMFAGRENDANVYHTPDGIINENLWEPKCVHFVSGTSAQKYITKQMGEEYAPTYISTGRPNLLNIYDKYKNCKQKYPDEKSEFELLVTTQPKDDNYRETFINDIIQAVEKSGISPNITIKIHPLENIEFYEDFKNIKNISVDDGDLFKHIKRSHLVVCPSSNVGIESVLAGTPSISYLPEPTIMKPDLKHGPIPVFSNGENMKQWLDDLDESKYTKLIEKQIDYVETHHRFESGSEDRINDHILNGKSRDLWEHL